MSGRPSDRLLLLLAAAVGLPSGGCDGPSAPGDALPAGELPAVVLDTPENAARSALALLRAYSLAVVRRDEQTAKACLKKLQTVAAVTTIERTLARMPQLKVVLGHDPVEGLVRNWAAAIAYYAGGLHLEEVYRASHTPSKVAIMVPASGPADDALIRVTCVREDDDLWRISRIEFHAEAAIATPASQPAAPAASEPS